MRISDWSSDVCSSDLLLVDGLRPLLQAKQRRHRRPMNVGVDQPRLHPQPGEADRTIGGDGGFADPALAACNGDEPPLATFGGTHDADGLEESSVVQE